MCQDPITDIKKLTEKNGFQDLKTKQHLLMQVMTLKLTYNINKNITFVIFTETVTISEPGGVSNTVSITACAHSA